MIREKVLENKKMLANFMAVGVVIAEPGLFFELIYFFFEHLLEVFHLVFEWCEIQIDVLLEHTIEHPLNHFLENFFETHLRKKFMQALAFMITSTIFTFLGWLFWRHLLLPKCQNCQKNAIARWQEFQKEWQELSFFAKASRFRVEIGIFLFFIFYLIFF